MARILFIHNYPNRFVLLDMEILRERHAVTEFFFRRRWVNPFALFRGVRNHDLVVGWFASWHTFLPFSLCRRLKKPGVLIIGGYDLAAMPEIAFGHQCCGFKRWVSRRAMKW